ncbi:MAG: cytochrome D1 domain-containing protein [Nitrospinota bacterium]|nr:cytochrome D1 domain-containing protein [Nitrospinota bacterium]
MYIKTKKYYIVLLLFIFSTFFLPVIVSAENELILITNTRDGTISIISRKKNEVIQTIKAGKKANRISLSIDKQKAFIINDGSPFARILDLKDFSFKKSPRVGKDPYNLAFGKNGKYAYFVNTYSDNLSVFDLKTRKIHTVFKHGGNNPVNIKISKNGKYAYVANELSEDVSIVDLQTYTIIKQIESGYYTEGIDVTQDGKSLYIANGERNSFSIVDTTLNTITKTVPLKDEPHDLLLTPNNKYLYITLPHLNTVEVFSTKNLNLVASEKQGIRPDLIAFTPDGELAYITNRDSREVFVMDAIKHKNFKRIKVGNGPHGVLVVPNWSN